MKYEAPDALSQKQSAALPHLASAPSIREGALRANISQVTVHKWLKNEVFTKALELYRRKLAKEGFDYLKSLIVKAVKVYEDLLGSDDESVKRLAAKDIMTFSQKVIDQEEIMERLEVLEDTTRHNRGA